MSWFGRKDADQDLQLNIDTKEIFTFPEENEIDMAIGVPETEQRIKDILMVLSNFKRFRQEGRSVLGAYVLAFNFIQAVY